MEHGREGIATGRTPVKVNERRGCKQIGRLVSAKTGKLGTLTLAVSATGNTVSPFFTVSG
jgi:hypothetical protein